jgi:ATP-dependent DNA ligase
MKISIPPLEPSPLLAALQHRQYRPQHQVCLVVGYTWVKNCDRAMLYLACGTSQAGRVRYVGRTVFDFGTRQARRRFAQQLRPLRLPIHPPLIASPLPDGITWIAPELRVRVVHNGWSDGGLLRNPQADTVLP